ncbi:MAG: hypothetical protein J5522_00200 [Lachnospiraceae bacterium]|nr:hypothetical protein [Lachnospiraceae bacterium]
MKKKRFIIAICIIVFLIILFYFTDLSRVNNEERPVFCIEVSENHFVGLGYSYFIYPHPITGKLEYVHKILGFEVENNITN